MSSSLLYTKNLDELGSGKSQHNSNTEKEEEEKKDAGILLDLMSTLVYNTPNLEGL